MRALSGRPSVFSSTARFLRDHMAWLNQGLQLRRWVALYTTSDETKGARCARWSNQGLQGYDGGWRCTTSDERRAMAASRS